MNYLEAISPNPYGLLLIIAIFAAVACAAAGLCVYHLTKACKILEAIKSQRLMAPPAVEDARNYCGRCGAPQKDNPVREIALPKVSMLVYQCAKCGLETAIPNDHE